MTNFPTSRTRAVVAVPELGGRCWASVMGWDFREWPQIIRNHAPARTQRIVRPEIAVELRQDDPCAPLTAPAPWAEIGEEKLGP